MNQHNAFAIIFRKCIKIELLYICVQLGNNILEHLFIVSQYVSNSEYFWMSKILSLTESDIVDLHHYDFNNTSTATKQKLTS